MVSLAHLLADAEPPQLQRIAGLWGVEEVAGQTQVKLQAALRDQMRLPFAARSVWQHLGQVAARCLYEIVTAPPKHGRSCEQLLKKTRLPVQAVEQALGGLQDDWLITESRLPPPIPLHGPRPDPDEAERVYLPLPECSDVLVMNNLAMQ